LVTVTAAAAGASTWILVVPPVMRASSEADQLKRRLLIGGAFTAIVAVAFIPPLVYALIPNPFRPSPVESATDSAIHTSGAEGPSLASLVPSPPVTADRKSHPSEDNHQPASAQMNAGAASEMVSQFVGTWRRPKKEGMETGYLGIAKRSDDTFTLASVSVVDGRFKAEGPPILVEGRRVGGAFSNVRLENGHLYAKYRYRGMDSNWEEEYDLTLEGSQNIVCTITGNEGKVVQLLRRQDATSPGTSSDAGGADPSISPGASAEKLLTHQAVIDDPDGYTNVRAGRSASSPIIAVVRAGEVFSTSPQAGNWWQVKTASGHVGFMFASKIRLRNQ
jgi:hypothetical protein